MREVILASTSPWRARMLAHAGVVVRTVPSGVDEDAEPEHRPEQRAIALALAKARAVAALHPSALVIGADQVVWDGKEVFGKPRDPADHMARLLSMCGNAHDLVTGWAVIGPEGERTGLERTTLHVRHDISEAELRAYVESGEGSGCAGGYAAEGHGAFLFERIEGDWFNVIGLPLHAVLSELRRHGWRYGASHET